MAASSFSSFTIGCKVEVTSDEDGFDGSWFVATLINIIKKKSKNRSSSSKSKGFMYEVKYDTLCQEDDKDELLTEVVDPCFVRPVPPVVVRSSDFEVDDVVDVYQRDGWWIGVVKSVIICGDDGENSSKKYVVGCLEDPTLEIESEKSGLRFHLEWVDSFWEFPPNNKKKKNSNERTCEAKDSKTVQKRKRGRSPMSQAERPNGLQEDSKQTDSEVDYVQDTAIVDKVKEGTSNKKKNKNAHQRKNKEKVLQKKETSFNLVSRQSPYQLVSILKSLTTRQQADLRDIGFGCMIGFNIEYLPMRLALLVVDRLDAVNCEMMVHGTLMKITKQDVHDILGFPMGNIAVKAGVEVNNLVLTWKTRYPCPKKICLTDVKEMIKSQPEGGSDFKIDILVAIMTRMGEGISCNTVNQRFLGSVNNENDIKNMDWCGYVIECLRRSKENGSWYAGPLAFLVVWYAQKISKQQKETPAILHWTREELNAVEKMEFSLGGSCSRPPNQHDEASGALNNDIMNTEYQRVWPFVKQSAIWATIESLEAFRQPPQKPHFSPLKKEKADRREGLAISCVVTFENLVQKISEIQLSGPVDTIKDSLETLVELETHGFDVGAVRARLNEMLSLKEKVDHLRDSKRKDEESEKCEQDEMNQLKVRVNKLQKEMETKNEKVKKLQSNLHLLTKQILDCEHSFKKLAATSS